MNLHIMHTCQIELYKMIKKILHLDFNWSKKLSIQTVFYHFYKADTFISIGLSSYYIINSYLVLEYVMSFPLLFKQ